MSDPTDDEREVRGAVKWYDSARGYGFIRPDDGGADVLLHANCVRAFGLETAPERAAIVVMASETRRGLQASRILSLDAAIPEAPPPSRPRMESADAPPEPQGPISPARVKWFDKQKGFGFLNLYRDPRDVFIHMEVVRAAGLLDLQTGEAVLARVGAGPRGLIATELLEWRTAETNGHESAPEPQRASDGRADRETRAEQHARREKGA